MNTFMLDKKMYTSLCVYGMHSKWSGDTYYTTGEGEAEGPGKNKGSFYILLYILRNSSNENVFTILTV